VLLYATDLNGDFDINFTYNDGYSMFADGEPVAFLNSSFDDLYPSFNSDFSRIYFCSDREEGEFNIFYVDVNYNNGEMVALLSDTIEYTVDLDPVLSSDHEDKCPYIFGNTLVFTSNRPGGSGGYDLYYSIFKSGGWSEPVNFGPEINTASDEYRPILFDPGVDYERDMMIFSSNREGGKGGFDLYFVGILKDL
jgi:Tol biopolymer transport system component